MCPCGFVDATFFVSVWPVLLMYVYLVSHTVQQAKTLNNVILRLECKECKAKMQLVIARCKHCELGEKKQATGHQY